MFGYFTLFGKQISMYAIMALLGMVAVLVYLFHAIKGNGYRRDQWLHIILSAAGGALVGGRIFFFFTRIPQFLQVMGNLSYYFGSFQNAIQTILSLFGGMVYYGGLFGGLFGAWLYCKVKKIDFNLHLDAAVPAIPLFHAFGRIGCLLGGCCYGVACNAGVYFPYSATADHSVRYFPIQIPEAIGNFLLFLMLYYFFRKGILRKRLLWVYLPIYAAARFILEFWRGDEVRGILFGLSTSQWISAALLVACAGYWINVICQKKHPRSEGAQVQSHDNQKEYIQGDGSLC